MRLELKPNESGYVKNWLVCGAKEETYKTDYFNPNQLEFEKKIREIIADDSLKEVPSNIKLGEKGLDDFRWEYYQARNNWFVDFSKFYFSLTKVELYASTILCVPCDKKVMARLWTFAAVEVWLNGKKQAEIKEPVYKPIKHVDIELDLQKGENDLFIRMQNLGVRDTRNIFGLQIRSDIDDVTVKTYDFENVYPIILAEQELMKLVIKDNKLCLGQSPSIPVDVNGSKWENGSEFPVLEQNITVSADVNGTRVSRKMENSLYNVIEYPNAKNLEEHQEKYLDIMRDKYADTDENCRKYSKSAMVENQLKITMDNIYKNSIEKKDIERIKNALPIIDRRDDCADFKLLDVLVIMKNAGDKFPAEVVEAVKKVILNFRYWMDEKGSDGMCFWSENHAVGFYACQLLAGLLYPDEIFVRSGRTGKQQYEIANARCREWLDSIEETGFEEFFSSGYMGVTFSVLLVLIDYAQKDVSERAWKIQDYLIRGMFTQTFDGCLAAPFGRVYGYVITPYNSEFQGMYSYFNKEVPLFTSGIIATYNLSRYTVPQDIVELMNTPVNKIYQTGNAEISICKTDDYILTSAASERSEKYIGGWSGDELRKENPYETGKFSFMYVKALNEKFHGTTLFQPGVYGYQQHLWTAALSKECLTFVNHPGATNQEAVMRPGYWYGNGLFPALRQWDNTLLAIYRLDDKHPIDFTHMYFPKYTFDEIKEDGNWIFGRKNNGMVGIWCSTDLKPHNDVLSDCEYRAYGKEQGYVCVCSDMNTEGSFDAFCEKCIGKEIIFDRQKLILNDGEGHEIQFIEKYNDSQVI